MKITVEDKTIVRTFVQLDGLECELGDLYDILTELDDSDLLLQNDELRDKLIQIGAAKQSDFRRTAITKGNRFSKLHRRIEKYYNKKYIIE
jgi:hypothetical protein